MRLKSDLRTLSIILAIGILYYLWILLTGIKIPCIFKLTTGFMCPGCGVTRMIVAATKFDFAAAFAYNKFLFVTWPILLLILGYSEWNYIKNGTRDIGRMNILLWIETILFIVFGIIRNLI